MKIDLLAAGVKPPSWVSAGYTEYVKRLPRGCELQLREIPLARRSKTTSADRCRRDEWERVQRVMTQGTHLVALDVGGKRWSTESFAGQLRQWQTDHGRVSMVIGGPDGLDDACLARANDIWSLSDLTFPHFLVRVLVAEQVYRGLSLLANHPYHRA